jgi:hypothetical protein
LPKSLAQKGLYKYKKNRFPALTIARIWNIIIFPMRDSARVAAHQKSPEIYPENIFSKNNFCLGEKYKTAADSYLKTTIFLGKLWPLSGSG